jgi:hypothetical protein
VSRRSIVIVRVVGAALLGAAGISAAVILGQRASQLGQSRDDGVTSSFAMVSSMPATAMQGTADIVNVSPEDGVGGRLAVAIEVGRLRRDGETEERATAAADRSAVDSVTVLFGGRLARSLGACTSDYNDVTIERRADYASLSESERNAVVANVNAQGQDRVIAFGEPRTKAATAPALEVAASMRYAVIRISSLYASSWSMTGQPAADQSSGSGTVDVKADGRGAYVECTYDQLRMMSTQSWGRRFEFPPITVATATRAGTTAQVESVRDLYRLRETPSYVFTTGYSFEGSDTLENYAGAVGSEDRKDERSDGKSTFAAASIPPAALSFQVANSTQWRDLALFAAGAAVSLGATMAISVGRRLAGLLLRAPGALVRRLRHR